MSKPIKRWWLDFQAFGARPIFQWATVDGPEILLTCPGMYQKLVNNGIFIGYSLPTSTGEFTGFLNHQQYMSVSFREPIFQHFRLVQVALMYWTIRKEVERKKSSLALMGDGVMNNLPEPAGGFNNFLFSSRNPGEMIQFDFCTFFRMGW